ncbi:MAG TPA: AsmA-like C-terminal domain-containing protein [Geobacterales bacterium]|nr:AsmA-like C-terminal domain-containing protein [Geobacterales bacterium]
MKRFLLRRFGIILALLLLITAVTFITILVRRLADLESYRGAILSSAAQGLGRPVSYEEAYLSLKNGPALTFKGITVLTPDGDSPVMTAEQVIARISILPLLQRRLVIQEILFDRPVVTLDRDASGKLSIDDLLTGSGKNTLSLQEITIHQGTLHFIDHYLPKGEIRTSLEELELHAGLPQPEKRTPVRMSAVVVMGKERGFTSLLGTITPPAKSGSWRQNRLKLDLIGRDLVIGHFTPYFRRHLPMSRLGGTLHCDLSVRGTLESFVSSGHIGVDQVMVDYSPVFRAPLTPQKVSIDYKLKVQPDTIDVQSLQLTVDTLAIQGRFALRDLTSSDPLLETIVAISPFTLKEQRPYIPFGVIHRGTVDFIDQHIKEGTFRVREASLHGRISQIRHLEKGNNADGLQVRGDTRDALLLFDGIPALHGIAGQLEIHGREFRLSEMSGRAGTSPFTMAGSITDIVGSAPARYPFAATVALQEEEVNWALHRLGATHLTKVSGPTILTATGHGDLTSYRLAGEWNITDAAVNHGGIITKPAHIPARAASTVNLAPGEVRIEQLILTLPDATCSAHATYRTKGGYWDDLGVTLPPLQLEKLSPFVPAMEQYHVNGSIGGNATATWNKKGGYLAWDGSSSFTDVTFIPPTTISTISEMTGTITLHDDTLRTSVLTGTLCSTPFRIQGEVAHISAPALTLTVASPRVNIADLGLHSDLPLRITDLQGSATWHREGITLSDFSAQVNSSILHIEGSYTSSTPRIQLDISSPELDLEEMRSLLTLRSTVNKPATRSQTLINLTLNADIARYRQMELHQLSAHTSYQHSTLTVDKLALKLLDGSIAAHGSLELPEGTPPTAHILFSLIKIPVVPLLEAFGIKEERLKGFLSAEGELTGKGTSLTELERSVTGRVKLDITEGNLRSSTTLTRIFALLNVSILTKLELPDMASHGLPFHRISGNVDIRDGVATTSDLLLKSDSLNISAVGSVNLPRRQLDMLIGVMPLQTVDKIVSRIPVIGWILTGSDQHFIAAYFEAKGAMNDPIVRAVPFSSMSKGVVDIFTRLFQLPAKLITDTGEVIMGK